MQPHSRDAATCEPPVAEVATAPSAVPYRSEITFPVLTVSVGSISRTQVSALAEGWCSTPCGTTIHSPGLTTTSPSRSRIVSSPLTTRKSSSSTSWWCQMKSPDTRVSFTATPAIVAPMRGRHSASIDENASCRFTLLNMSSELPNQILPRLPARTSCNVSMTSMRDRYARAATLEARLKPRAPAR